LYVGSDTDYIGNFQYLHKKIAFFPLAGGTTVPSKATASLPANVFLAGQLPNANTSNVLYRVDAGGPAVGAIDNGPDWAADASDSDEGAQYRNTGSSSASWNQVNSVNPSVPSSTPSAIFNSERWDPGDANEMHWSFPSLPARRSRCASTSPTATRAQAASASACSTFQSTARPC
jgi:hypothetical protein